MIGALDVLVVDDRPETVRFLTEFLLQRCRRVDVATSVKEAEAAIARRRAAHESYHLIFCDFVMPGVDGMALLRQLRQHHDNVPFVFITGYRTLNPTFETEAQRLGVLAILDKPLELHEIERLLDVATATYRRQREAQAKDQPFFGTSRLARQAPSAPPPPSSLPALEVQEPLADSISSSTIGFQPDDFESDSANLGSALEPRPGAAGGGAALNPAAAPLDPRQLPPNDPRLTTPVAGYQRQPRDAHAPPSSTTRTRRSVDPPPVHAPQPVAPQAAPPAASPSPPSRSSEAVRRPSLAQPQPPGGGGAPLTGRLNAPPPVPPPPRAITPLPEQPPPPSRIATPLPQTSFTARMRRGVEIGAPAPPQPSTTATPDPTVQLVTCEHCGKAFAAPLKLTAYTTVCIHCGHLQQVGPQ